MAAQGDANGVRARFWRGVNHLIISVFHGALVLTARRKYRHLERIPSTGGAIIVSNHISLLDAFVLPHAVRKAGRNPLGMGKVELFHIPVVGKWFTKIGHVAVDRKAASPSVALEPAAEALRSGQVLCMYPEGTINHTPERGLLEGRTGVARLALASGVPVVPIGQWGPQEALSSKGKLALLRKPKMLGWLHADRKARRPVCQLLVGEPISPDEIAAAAKSTSGEEDLRAATDLVMTRLGALVAEISGVPESARLAGGTPARKFTRATKPSHAK